MDEDTFDYLYEEQIKNIDLPDEIESNEDFSDDDFFDSFVEEPKNDLPDEIEVTEDELTNLMEDELIHLEEYNEAI